MKKGSVLLLFSLLFVLVLSACGSPGDTADDTESPESASSGSKDSSQGSNEVVTITTSITDGELSKEQIAEFEKEHPNIKVELDPVDATKLAAKLATGDAPDIIRVNGVFDLPNYVIKGIAMDITSKVDGSSIIKKEDLLPIADVYRFDGRQVGAGPLYGLPKDWSNDYAIWYNKKAFEAAGVPLPDPNQPLTWTEVMELAQRLTIRDGDKIVQYGLSANEWGKTEPNFNNMLQYLLSAGAHISSDDNSSIEFDHPAVREYIELWVNQAVKANVGPNSLNNDQTSGGDLFTDGKSAMIINGYWYGGVLRSNENTREHLEDFGMLPAPTAPGGKRVSPTGAATGAIINKNTKHPEEAWTFFEWFFGGKPADDRAKSGWGLPIFQSKMELLPQTTEFDAQVYQVLQDELKYSGEYLEVNPYLAGGGWAIFEKYVQPLYFDKSNVDEAVKGMSKDANVIIKEAMNAINP